MTCTFQNQNHLTRVKTPTSLPSSSPDISVQEGPISTPATTFSFPIAPGESPPPTATLKGFAKP